MAVLLCCVPEVHSLSTDTHQEQLNPPDRRCHCHCQRALLVGQAPDGNRPLQQDQILP
jgi:hypothetical protein